MKKLWLLLFIILLPQLADAAIPAGTVWEVRTAGSDTNGGGFVAGITSISSKTDLAVSAGSNLNVSSSGYGFTSADVGRWLTITAGTGWTTGSYQIISVAAGVATLNRSPAPISTGSGSFTIYYGLDYSQQNAANSSGSNISTTDLVTNGTTTITSATAAFTNDVVGNIVYIAGGTGSITGAWYEITAYTNATTVIVDRATGLTTGTGATLNIGGALATFGKLSSVFVGGNIAFIKATAVYSITSGVTFGQSGGAITGYTSIRGDNGQATIQGSTTSNLILITTNGFKPPTFNNITFDCNSLSGCSGLVSTIGGGQIYNCKAKNYAVRGFYINTSGGGYGVMGNIEATGGLSGSTAAISLNGGSGGFGGVVYGSYVHDGIGPGIVLIDGPAAIRNIVSNQSGTTSDCINLSSSFAFENSVYNCGRDGIRTGGNPFSALGNILDSNAGYGINSTSTMLASPLYDGNAYYNNTLGNRHGIDDTVSSSSDPSGASPYTNIHDVILTSDPFVNASSGNFALNNTGGGGGSLRGTGLPSSWPGLSGTTAYPDFGAVQHQCSGTGNSASCVFGN